MATRGFSVSVCRSAYDDVIPTGANLANLKILQLAPLPAACDPTVPQAPQQSGIVCVMAYGSARNRRWDSTRHILGLVTPSSGEVVTNW
jgi:hypothetical protein